MAERDLWDLLQPTWVDKMGATAWDPPNVPLFEGAPGPTPAGAASANGAGQSPRFFDSAGYPWPVPPEWPQYVPGPAAPPLPADVGVNPQIFNTLLSQATPIRNSATSLGESVPQVLPEYDGGPRADVTGRGSVPDDPFERAAMRTRRATIHTDSWLRDENTIPDFSPDKPGWHNYRTGPTQICTPERACTREEAIDVLRRFAVPGQDPSKTIESNQIYPVYDPRSGLYGGRVRSTMSNDGLTVTNLTMPGHALYKGVIIRRLYRGDDGGWYVETHGYGNNTRPFGNYVNEWQGPEIFNTVDAQMRRYIEQNRARE